MPRTPHASASPDPTPSTPDLTALLADDAEPDVRVPLAIEDWLSVILLALLAVLTLANVLVRYFSNQSFAWTEEISIFLMIVMTMVASSAAVARNRHIRIDFLVDRASPERRRRFTRIAAATVAVTFWLMGVLSARLTWDQYTYGDVSAAIGVPEWWYSIWMPILSIAIALRAAGVWRRS
jgi:TRAP-type C4-dicarboxylate transport system permease small subunit